jgi:glutamate-1-semialdehyde 2,1-aminomutase
MRQIDRSRLATLQAREEERFVTDHPKSERMFDRAKASLLGGVPMPWMSEWAGPFPIFAEDAEGARVTDVDGHTYVDFCLGDTGSMTGHSPKIAAAAISEQASRGITVMLPTEDSIWVGEEMKRRFGLSYWQFCLTATDANRFTIRIARGLTRRPKILVFNYCYHGTVDETFITINDGVPGARPGLVGAPVDPTVTTRVVEFNDVDALERELANGDVACVLAEPAMTNIGIILPDPGFHAAMRELTRKHRTFLVIDETHTFCAGPGGYTRAYGLDPDFLTIGKPLGSGVPSAAYGMSEAVAERMGGLHGDEPTDTDGIGGTLSGNALALHAMRATLENVLTEEAFARMIPLAERWAAGVQGVIDSRELPWCVVQLGARAEFWSYERPPRNGGEAEANDDHELDRFLHLYALNRGILLTPFHNMALMSPETTEADVDLHTEVFAQASDELIG